MQNSDRENIRRRLAETQKLITRLQEQQEEAETTLQSLREQLARSDTNPTNVQEHTDETRGSEQLTPVEKVDLFLRLFRGRDDVYPKLWQNQKTAKKGYAPACANEWVRGVCEKLSVPKTHAASGRYTW
jgi:hypothetical protein